MLDRFRLVLALAAGLFCFQIGPGVQVAEATRIDDLRSRTGASLNRVQAVAKRIQSRSSHSHESSASYRSVPAPRTAAATQEEKEAASTQSIEAEDNGRAVVPVPEPSAALIFGMGLFIAHRAARKRS